MARHKNALNRKPLNTSKVMVKLVICFTLFHLTLRREILLRIWLYLSNCKISLKYKPPRISSSQIALFASANKYYFFVASRSGTSRIPVSCCSFVCWATAHVRTSPTTVKTPSLGMTNSLMTSPSPLESRPVTEWSLTQARLTSSSPAFSRTIVE